jgi:predicted thioredoxin/glutaredoxin
MKVQISLDAVCANCYDTYMTIEAERLLAEIQRIEAQEPNQTMGTVLPGNTVKDVATILGMTQCQIERAIDELSGVGLARNGRLWSKVGDYREVVALGCPRYA